MFVRGNRLAAVKRDLSRHLLVFPTKIHKLGCDLGTVQMLNFRAVNAVFNTVKVFQSVILPKRWGHGPFVQIPKPDGGKNFRRIVHFPEEYTVKPLKVTNLAGRDPVTGRIVVKGLGGGIKHKYHWIKWIREGPEEGPPLEEKVIQILKCGCRTSHVALVGVGDDLKYILATVNMKPGDIIKTSKCIPANPVKANEGDSYPAGALPLGTIVHNVQLNPASPVTLVHSAGSFATIKSHMDDRVVIALPNKHEIAVKRECMVTVGRLSNIEHSSIKLGSPQKKRELGYRPRSGLWQRKTGRFGRKIRQPPKVKIIADLADTVKLEPIRCTLPSKKC